MDPVPLEEQLDVLADCGMEFVSPDAQAHAIQEWGRAPLENRPYDLVLAALGDEYAGKDGAWRPSGIGVWHIDTECIYTPDDYVNVITYLGRLARGDVSVSKIEAQLDDPAWVRFDANGELLTWDVELNNDWLDVSVIERFARLLRATGAKRRFYASESDAQDFLLICPTKNELRQLVRVCPTKFFPVVD